MAMPDQYDERARALRGLLTTAISGGFPESRRPEIIEATIQAVFAYTRAVAAEQQKADARVCERLSFHDSIGIDFADAILAQEPI
jgi:hypothetical protein